MKNLQSISFVVIAALVGIIFYNNFYQTDKKIEQQKAEVQPIIEQLRPLEAFLGEWTGGGDGYSQSGYA